MFSGIRNFLLEKFVKKKKLDKQVRDVLYI